MAEILHTRDREASIRLLASTCPRVLVRNQNFSWRPLRFRREWSADLSPYICLNPKEFDSQLLRWNSKGGVLIYDRKYRRKEDLAPHHAQVFSDCPMFRDMLHWCTEGTADVAVVFLPPSWEGHRATVRALYPTADSCRHFFAVAQDSPAEADLGQALKITTPFVVCSDADMQAEIGVDAGQLRRILASTLRPRDALAVRRFIPRIEPRDDAVLQRVYRAIRYDCPATAAGVHLVVGTRMSTYARYWQLALRMLVRRGYVQEKPAVHVYQVFPAGTRPDWKRIEAAHKRGARELDKMIAFIEAAPEFEAPPAAPRGRSRSACASPESGARARDTAD